MVKKADILLITAGLLAAAGIWVLLFLFPRNGQTVVIHCGNSVYGSYPLAENRTVTIDRDGLHNVIRIENSQVFMEESSCAGGQCISQGRISHSGESIVCLPNHLVAEITGEEGEYDAIAS